MTPAERARITEAARRAAEDAPPLSADVVEMLRRDGCPSLRQSRQVAS